MSYILILFPLRVGRMLLYALVIIIKICTEHQHFRVIKPQQQLQEREREREQF